MAKNFKQYDSKWGNLPYPSGSDNLANSGCGCVACTDLVVYNPKYAKYTPKQVRKYMVKKGYAVKGQGTSWYGIQPTLEHYGLKVKWPDLMTDLFKLLNKGPWNCGILLMKAGTKGGITWTTVGHFIAFTDYKVKGGKHYFKIKDPGPRDHDGWYCYETTMKGLVRHCWCAYVPSEEKKEPKPAKKSVDDIAKEVIDGKWGVGEERKERLEKAGYNYSEVQDKVNEILNKEKTLIDKEMDACKEQAEWMKNYHYEWESKPTVAKSKKKGTCVTYVACVLQRIGVLKSGQYIWQNGKGYGTGKVTGATSNVDIIYMKNKTFTDCKGKLKRGDVVIVDDNKSGVPGNGGHIMIFAGKWSKDGDPYIWDNHSAERVKAGKNGLRTYSKNHKILAIARLK